MEKSVMTSPATHEIEIILTGQGILSQVRSTLPHARTVFYTFQLANFAYMSYDQRPEHRVTIFRPNGTDCEGYSFDSLEALTDQINRWKLLFWDAQASYNMANAGRKVIEPHAEVNWDV